MAMRTVARRWPGAAQVRASLRSGRQQQQSRAFEEAPGKGLERFTEKEKAAENRFIRQHEEEQKLKKMAGEATHPAGNSPASTPDKVTSADGAVSEAGGFRNTAVVAGIVAVVAGYWLLSGSGSSKKEEKESA